VSASAEYTSYILELIEPVVPVRTGRFFGGVGIYYDAVQFAMIMGNCLYFVVDNHTREKYIQAGMQPFSYATRAGRVSVQRYYEVPEHVLSDAELLKLWAHHAIRIAASTKSGVSKRRLKK
jgi:DNA transformation protein and related proteins